MKSFLVTVVGVVATATAAQAVELTGGAIELSYSAFMDETDLDKVSISGSLEVAFNRNISAQLDLGNDSFGTTDLSIGSVGLHGIYHVSDVTSLGAYYTRDNFDIGGADNDVDLYGVEIGHEIGQNSLEAYLGRNDTNGSDGTMVGISGTYALANGFSLTGSLDYLDVEGADLENVAVRLDRDVAENINLFVEVGSSKASAFGVSDSEPFIGIGGRISFGADRGATFGRRSLGDLLPGL